VQTINNVGPPSKKQYLQQNLFGAEHPQKTSESRFQNNIAIAEFSQKLKSNEKTTETKINGSAFSKIELGEVRKRVDGLHSGVFNYKNAFAAERLLPVRSIRNQWKTAGTMRQTEESFETSDFEEKFGFKNKNAE